MKNNNVPKTNSEVEETLKRIDGKISDLYQKLSFVLTSRISEPREAEDTSSLLGNLKSIELRLIDLFDNIKI